MISIIQRSEAYQRALKGEKVLPAKSKRTVFCINLGKPKSGGVCKASVPHQCDLLNKDVSHNGKCQDCNDYVADE